MKLLKTIFLTFIIMMSIQPMVYAENSVGLAAGSTKGLGVTYRHLNDNNPWGWQVTGLPVVMPDGGFVNAGFSALYVLHKGNVGSAFLSLGAAGGIGWNRCDDNEAEWGCEETADWLLGVGPGIGFELRLVDNFAWATEFVLPILVSNGEFEGVYPIPNMSLVYYW